MRSAKLQAFFANNPRERDLLETNTHPISLKLHSTAIGDVPEYMVPKALRGIDFSSGGKRKSKLGQKHRRRIKQSFNQKKHKRMQKDPLRSYKA
uniref:DUF1713 domain-containing protein n=1 Tax=Heterorhabditis bacteriophora TaxID=37862 RepID=A0A1I7WDU1_HETBA